MTPSRSRALLGPLVGLGLTALGLFFAVYLLDWILIKPEGGPFELLLKLDLDTIKDAIATIAQTVAAVLGIVITVVSIVVQLASTRYTPRIANLFFQDRLNVSVIGFFVVACVHAIWVSITLSTGFVPKFSALTTLALATMSLLIIGPYFAYVFEFLDPERIISRLRDQALSAASVGVTANQAHMLNGVERVADIAMSAVSQRDKAISQNAINALRQLAVAYQPRKATLDSSWFEIGKELMRNPDFVSLAPSSVADLQKRRVWVEWKVLRQYQSIYNEAMNAMPDINHVIAIDTRYIGEAAIDAKDRATLELTVKFFNTYMRSTLNGSRVRTAYNVLHQYRQLAEHALMRGEGDHGDLVTALAGHLKYYGQLAHSSGLPFITETVAYDLGALTQLAFERGAKCHEALLEILLQLDKAAETKAEEKALRGVRKAQIKLATYYLVKDAEVHARRVHLDMKDEQVERISAICDELLSVESEAFWEVVDRGTNFDYLPPEQKAALPRFRAWFMGRAF
jgi:hypothetical protein